MSDYNPNTKIWSGATIPSTFNTDVSLGFLMLNEFRKTPERVTQINADDGKEITCGEMFKRSVKMVKFLSSLGLKQNDVVGIVAKNSENLLPVVIACLTMGLPINPLATVMNENDIGYMYAKTRPKVIFSDFDLVSTVRKSIAKIALEKCEIFTFIEKVEGFKFVDDLISKEEECNDEDFVFPELVDISSSCAFILCSSGTTDMVKGIMKSHKHFIANTMRPHHPPLDVPEVIFFPTQLYWVSGVFSIIYSALYGAKRVITTKNMTAELFVEIVNKFNVTFTFASPAIQYPLIKGSTVGVMEKVRAMYLGGVAINEEVVKKLQILCPKGRILACYATTEAGMITVSEKAQRGASSGNATYNCQIKIIDSDGNNLGPNEKGEICVKPLVLPSGYFDDPEKFAQAINDGWVLSGDLGYFDNDGYLFVLDRIKYLLKSLTLHFTPLELETIINEVEGVIESSVVGVFDEGNDVVYAFVMKNKESLKEEEVKSYVNQRVNEQKSVREVVFIDTFPRTPSGKVRKEILKEMAKTIHESKKN